MFNLNLIVITHLSLVSDSQAVQRPHSYVDHLLPPEALHHGGLPDVLVRPMTQPEVVPLAPCPDHTGLAEGEAELCSTFDLNKS